jgi:hypothetical protein
VFGIVEGGIVMHTPISVRACAVALAAAVIALLLVAQAAGVRKRLNPVDQAAAKRAELKASDLPGDFKWIVHHAGSSSSSSSGASCPGYNPKTSDLVVTGESGASFHTAGAGIETAASLFQTPHMVALDWKRRFVPAFAACLRHLLLAGGGPSLAVISITQLALPPIAPRIAAYRALYRQKVRGAQKLAVYDFIELAGGRTEVILKVALGLGAPSQVQQGEAFGAALDVRLATILARRAHLNAT